MGTAGTQARTRAYRTTIRTDTRPYQTGKQAVVRTHQRGQVGVATVQSPNLDR